MRLALIYRLVSFLFVCLPLSFGTVSAQTVSNGSVTGSPVANSGINAGNAPPWSACYFSPDLCDPTFPSYSGNSTVTPAYSPDGGTWLGSAGNGECAQTTITGLVSGNTYTLYFCGANFGTAALYSSSPATPEITIGTAVQMFSIPQAASVWNSYSMSFTANASTMTMQIRHSSNAYASLDGFNLTGSICSPVVLPIEMVWFDGQYDHCGVHLEWQLPEEEFERCEIWRSADGADFERIGWLPVSANERRYSYKDELPLEQGYYRVHMVNKNGLHGESHVLTVSGTCDDMPAQLIGNPVESGMQALLRFRPTGGEAVIQITTLDGRVVSETRHAVTADSYTDIVVETAGLRPGVYLVTTPDGVREKLVVR